MGNRSWGKGYYTGFAEGVDKGLTKGLIIAFSLSLANSAISAIGDYITTRKLKVEKIIENGNKRS